PASRGYLLDATPSDRRGEAFGIYGAAQMAGFLLGPALGALAASATGRPESVFILGGISVAVAGVVVAFAVPELPHGGRDSAMPPEGLTELQREPPGSVGRAAAARTLGPTPDAGPAAPVTSLWNRTLIAAIVLNFGAFFAGGTW